VVPVIARRLREWPRATAAVAVLAVGLVLIGVLVASTGSGGSARAASRSQPAHAAATNAPAGAAGKAQLARLQYRLTQATDQLAATRSALTASQAAVQCWQGKAHHPRKERAVTCPAGS
jgi:hypothetical protein